MTLSSSDIQELLLKFYPILNEEDAEVLMSISTYKIFNRKEIILKRGRKDKKFFITLEGAARSYTIVNGEELNCHLRGEGFLMGDANCFGENPLSLLDTAAVTDIHILIFDMDDLERISLGNPQMMTFYLNIMKEIIVVFSHRIHTFVTMDASQRYSDLIKWNPIFLKSTFDKHLASFLGITPLTFHRVKNKVSNDISDFE